TKINATLSIAVTITTAIGSGVSVPDASPSVRLAMNSAQIAAIAAPSHGPRLRMMTSHTSAYAATASAATSIVGAQVTGGTRDHAKTMIDAAIVPAACSSPEKTAIDVAVSASVSTPSAAKSGHGGIDHAGSIAVRNRNKCPSSPRYVPWWNPNFAGSKSLALRASRYAHTWPASIVSVRITRNSSDGRMPTAAAALPHHTARTSHDNAPPATDSAGSSPAALSMKIAAFRIASSTARPQIADAECEPIARNSST